MYFLSPVMSGLPGNSGSSAALEQFLMHQHFLTSMSGGGGGAGMQPPEGFEATQKLMLMQKLLAESRDR
jgi:hypothetical protein